LASQTSICDEEFRASAFCISWADDSRYRFLLVMVNGQEVVGPLLIIAGMTMTQRKEVMVK
jgi:hypothetical protein